MTGHEHRPDVRQRRRVGQIRAMLGLTHVPPQVGAELQTISAVVSAQVQVQLRREVPRYAALSPEEQLRLVTAITRAVDEFARIVANRPLDAPVVGATLIEIARDATHPERFILALHTALEAVRAVMRDAWPTLALASSHTVRLEFALARYVEELGARTMNALHPLSAGRHDHQTEEAQLSAVLALVEHRWRGRPVQLCLGLTDLTTEDDTAPAPARTPAVAADRREGPRLVCLVAPDHLLLVTQHRPGAPGSDPTPWSARATQASRATRPGGVLWGGPVSAGEVGEAYETALLMFRLVRAGIAATVPSGLLALPRLGFLRARPNQAAVTQILGLLEPLTRQSAHRRVSLARTLQLRLRTGGTARALADQLGLHEQSARNHLSALRRLFDNPDLDFGQQTIILQAALDLVLPLWEVESSGPETPH